jgi:hypothetical protein
MVLSAEDTTLESGHDDTWLPLFSLGGVRGKPHLGRSIRVALINVPTTGAILANDNPKRISMIIANQAPSSLMTSTDIIGIQFKNSANTFICNPGDALQIDKDFPTTTQIYGVSNSKDATVCLVEISVQ